MLAFLILTRFYTHLYCVKNISGLDTPIAELMDFICAAQLAKEADDFFPLEDDVTIVQNPTHGMVLLLC